MKKNKTPNCSVGPKNESKGQKKKRFQDVQEEKQKRHTRNMQKKGGKCALAVGPEIRGRVTTGRIVTICVRVGRGRAKQRTEDGE